MATIGDLTLKVLGDFTEFERKSADSARKAGDTAAKGWGDSFKKAGVTALAVGLAGAFAAMSKGAAEMERAQGDFQAATGRSREEAVAFANDMNGLVGRASTVGRSFEEISAAGIQVAQQFDVTGDEATALTEDFLAFSKVTGQDAAGAVDDFDAALDAFGEPAERATTLMDQLVASNQEYGTVAGPAALSALAAMAPALTAMNMGLDDGIELLNAFESVGVDAESTTMALNKAVTQLQPGENLDDLIAELGAIEDPTLRAQRAVELFGRSGAKMALAIRPGMTSLDEFGVSVDEAAGATDRASDSMVTTTDRIRMAFEQLRGGLRDVGAEFGPLVTGLASLGTILAPVLRTIGPAIVKGIGLDVAMTSALTAIQGNATVQRAATALGNNTGRLVGLGFLAGVVAVAPMLADAIAPHMENARHSIAEGLFGSDQAQAEYNAAGGRMAGTIFDSLGDAFGNLASWNIAVGEPTVAATERIGAEAADAMLGSFLDMFQLRGGDMGDAVEPAFGDVAESAEEMDTRSEAAFIAMAASADRHAGDIADTMGGLGASIRDGIRSGTEAAREGMRDLMWAIEHPNAGQKYEDWLKNMIERAEQRRATAQRNGNTVAVAQADTLLADLRQRFTAIGNLSGTFTTSITFSGHRPTRDERLNQHRGRASGGHQAAGEMGIIGELGPEFWMPDSAGTVKSNGWLRSAIGQAASIGANANSTLRVEHVLTREGAAALREEGFNEEGVAGFLRNLDREYGLPPQTTTR